jgi:spore protease
MQGIRSNPLDPEGRPTVQDLQKHDVSEKTSEQMLGMLGKLDAQEKRQLIHEVLSPLGQNLIVTPKEIDSFISHIARIVANGINCALHETVNMENVSSHLH